MCSQHAVLPATYFMAQAGPQIDCPYRWPECVCCLLSEGKETGLQVNAAVPCCSRHSKSESASTGQLCDETKFEVKSNTLKAATAVHSSCICGRPSSDQARLADARTPFVADLMDLMFGCD